MEPLSDGKPQKADGDQRTSVVAGKQELRAVLTSVASGDRENQGRTLEDGCGACGAAQHLIIS